MVQKEKEDIYEWLSKITFLNSLSCKTKTDIQSSFEVIHPILNQVVVKEGSKIHYIYIIAKGEFELSKLVKSWDENDDVSSISTKLSFSNKQYQLGSQKRSYYKDFCDSNKYKAIKVNYLGEGSLLWAVDYFYNRSSTFTITWKSFESTLYRIKVEDFNTKIMK